MKRFDVIVIGAGAGGLNIASFMNRAGFSALLIDREDRAIGGDCLNFGCVPSKAFIHVARLARDHRAATRFGLTSGGAVDLAKVMAYVREKREHIRAHENAAYLRSLGITVALGTASFVDAETVEVAGARYRGKKIVIATGSRPRPLSLPGIEAARIHNNESIFSLETLPKRMAIVGAGPIGIELGQAFRFLGSQVAVVGPELLAKEDPEIVAPLRTILERDGMELLIGYKPVEVKGGDTLLARNDSGETREVPFDLLFASVGREADLKPLNLGAAGIQTDARGHLILDRYLRTTNRRVLAIGDAAGMHQFTHAAETHAALVLHNFFSPFPKKLNTDSMAWVTFTTPELATFGLGEQELARRGTAYEALRQDFAESDRAIVDEHTEGKLKVFVSPRGRVLGGTMLAENAGEIAEELMLAEATGLRLASFLKKVYPYPVASRVNRSLALSYAARALTERAGWLLRLAFH